MLPKAPKVSDGKNGIEKYQTELRLIASSLSNRLEREFYRKELSSRSKLYKTLSGKRPAGSPEQHHFRKLSQVHKDELEAFGPEPPPKKRQSNLGTALLEYPELPKECTKRVHFLANGSLRRERSAALAVYADAVSKQIAPNGDVLLSAAVHAERAQFFERLLESIGSSGLGVQLRRKGGFTDPKKSGSPWRRIIEDNSQAFLYTWKPQLAALDPFIQTPERAIRLPSDIPAIPESLPYDPDPRFQTILSFTQEDQLVEAARLVDEIPPLEREVLFDEILYLRYLVGQAPTGNDLRYLARRYITGSSIRERLEEEFDAFISYLDQALVNSGPIPNDFPGLTNLDHITQSNLPERLKRTTPPLSDWKATRENYYQEHEDFGPPPHRRGRIFIWHPDIASSSISRLKNIFCPEFVEAEEAFRRANSIAEIGRGWVSETALFDLVRAVYPDAVHQWRPVFLGLQSIDIYIPEINLAIEYQGEQHYGVIERFGGEPGFIATQERDARKRALLETNGVQLLEWKFDRPLKKSEVRSALKDFETF